MIRISLGNIGSGKTVNEVREMILNRAKRSTYSNIIMKQPKTYPYIKLLDHSMIINKQVVDTKVNKKTGEEKPIYELKLNVDFWKAIKEPVNVVLDEAHSIINSRRAMSNVNIIMSDWLALIRRVLGSAESGMGELVFITQLHNRIDNIAREMASQVRFHMCHYIKRCKLCRYWWRENSETAEPLWVCPRCRQSHVLKQDHQIQVWHFRGMSHYLQWRMLGRKTYHRCYVVKDIEKYFPFYDTLQWDNMFSDYY